MTNFILIDGSYFCFFRYYAIMQWWKLSKPDIPLDIPYNNVEFVEKFRISFIEKVKDIQKKLRIDNPIIIVGKDCPRQNIWRHKYLSLYKGTRNNDVNFHGKPFFKMAYDSLWKEAGVHTVVQYPSLEADDCIALTVERIIESVDNPRVWIIASDMDYLQLVSPIVSIYNLKYQNIATSKNATGDPMCDIFCKIVCGDKSDNIPGIFKKCGIKTSVKLFHNKEEFHKKILLEDAKEKYKRNTILIDFRMIPDELKQSFRKDVLLCV